MSNEKEETKKDLAMSDFHFLKKGDITRMELRFNENTGEDVKIKCYFPVTNDRDDTQLAFYTSGKDFEECMTKLHSWYNNFFSSVKVFNKLTNKKDES